MDLIGRSDDPTVIMELCLPAIERSDLAQLCSGACASPAELSSAATTFRSTRGQRGLCSARLLRDRTGDYGISDTMTSAIHITVPGHIRGCQGGVVVYDAELPDANAPASMRCP